MSTFMFYVLGILYHINYCMFWYVIYNRKYILDLYSGSLLKISSVGIGICLLLVLPPLIYFSIAHIDSKSALLMLIIDLICALWLSNLCIKIRKLKKLGNLSNQNQ
ncbi:Uncharacterised protein [Helicobacter muridarum]|uniref:Uncharacterized protein n=1 Tax=Helicobacter muridarum TaxID=216 RepID=A0A099TXS0_9HELI|nr:Uncharacterised protein [Helicobacter muridarum]